jgi:hypothetical protein
VEIKIKGGAGPDWVDNGLMGIGTRLQAGAKVQTNHITITVWRVATGLEDYEDGELTLNVRPVHIEVVSGAEAEQAMAMLENAQARRIGDPVQPTLSSGTD